MPAIAVQHHRPMLLAEEPLAKPVDLLMSAAGCASYPDQRLFSLVVHAKDLSLGDYLGFDYRL